MVKRLAAYGPYDVCNEALSARERANKNSLIDLNSYILTFLLLDETSTVLELGCGNGSLMEAILQQCPTAHVVGVDVDEQAVKKVRDKGMRAVKASFEDFQPDRVYQYVVSVYSAYYAKDMPAMLKSYVPYVGESLLVFGPGEGTNRELTEPLGMEPIRDFFHKEEIEELGKSFKNTMRTVLENKVFFDTADQFLDWWRKHNSYRPELEPKALQSLTFPLALSKNVLGVIFSA